MAKPALVIMAAGMGSRFGGLKQITPVDDYGHAILDFSLFDAKRAGFDTVVFIIKHAIEKEFKEAIGNRMEQYFDVRYVYQELDVLPEGYTVPAGRTKPWGTAHAILTAAPAIDGSFAVINADDFYGRTAFSTVYDFLSAQDDENKHAMVAYRLRNTVTENGSVSRGICTAEDGYLKIRDHLFDIDTYVFRNQTIKEISLCTPDKKPYVTISCARFPDFGIWSKSDEAPFVCLEPWYGSADNLGFEGELPDKYGILSLEAGKEFTAEYRILIHA